MAVPQARGREFHLTDFARAIFDPAGLDPFLEDVRTLWLLHWQLASKSKRPLFAWEHLISRWALPEFSRSEALAAFRQESRKLGADHSDATLGQHLDVFLNTYIGSRSAGPVEDSLDGPLVGLEFLLPVGDRRNDAGHREPVFAFRREPKPEIGRGLFDYCVMDFWKSFSPGEETLSQRQVSVGLNSPGQVFKLPEEDIRARLEEASSRSRDAAYSYQPSAVQGQLTRRSARASLSLDSVYDREPAYA